MLNDKVAVVTGGARGIGRGIVQMLAGQGCRVAFNYLKSRDQALALQDEIRRKGGQCLASAVDIKDPEAVKNWIAQVKQEWGRLDILINNAGITADKPLFMMTSEDWHKVMDTNLNGMFHASRACIVTFLKQKSGNIVNISSVSGIIGLPGQTNYSASKGAINSFTKALAKEVAAYGIRVNAVAPGFIETDMLSGLNEKYREQMLQKIPLGRVGRVEDVANCVKFFLSDAAAYITGQIIPVDGGLVMK